MIRTLKDITVFKWMAAEFDGERDDIENWENLYLEYIDLMGVEKTPEYGLTVAIHNLNVRIHTIDIFISAQQKFIELFNIPFEEGFQLVRKYGYKLNWEAGYPEKFLNQINRMSAKEKRNISELDSLKKQLSDIKKTGKVLESNPTRVQFVRDINFLSKQNGYPIDEDKMKMDRYCLLIRDHNDKQEGKQK